MANIIEELLTYLEVKHTKYFVNKLYNEHPHNENMYGLKDMLKSYSIESVGIDIKDKDEAKLSSPSICHVENKFAIVLGYDKRRIYIGANGRKSAIDLSTFKKQWDGKALLIMSTDNAQENDYYYNLGLQWITKISFYGLLCIPYLLLLVSLFYNPAAWNLLILPIPIFNIIGCVICYLLLQKRIKSNSTISDKFCSLITENGCDTVLTSGSSTIFYIYSWSEIGLAYFLSNLLILSLAPHFLTGLILVNYMAMAYGIWSVWYQVAKVKKWCTLCLSVQFCIWFLGIYYSTLLYNNMLKMSDVVISLIIVMLFIILAVITIHIVIKSYLDNFVMTLTVQKLKKFQVDNDILKAKCIKEEKYSDSLDASSVFYGDLNAVHHVTILLNPHCPHCRDFHKKIEPLLQKDSLKIGIRFIFISFGPQYDYACRIFIAAYQQMSKRNAIRLLSLWFDDMFNNNEDFAQKHGLDINHVDVVCEYERHKRWAAYNHLHKTPYVLVNDYVLPDIYEVEDIEKMDEI